VSSLNRDETKLSLKWYSENGVEKMSKLVLLTLSCCN